MCVYIFIILINIFFLIIVKTIYINTCETTNYLFLKYFVPTSYCYTNQGYRHARLYCSQHSVLLQIY